MTKVAQWLSRNSTPGLAPGLDARLIPSYGTLVGLASDALHASSFEASGEYKWGMVFLLSLHYSTIQTPSCVAFIIQIHCRALLLILSHR